MRRVLRKPCGVVTYCPRAAVLGTLSSPEIISMRVDVKKDRLGAPRCPSPRRPLPRRWIGERRQQCRARGEAHRRQAVGEGGCSDLSESTSAASATVERIGWQSKSLRVGIEWDTEKIFDLTLHSVVIEEENFYRRAGTVHHEVSCPRLMNAFASSLS